MALKPGPAPWRQEDHKAMGCKVVDAKGESICFLHYPQTLEQHANLRLLLKAPELLERIKGLTMILRAATMFQGRKSNPALIAAEELVESIETMKAAPKPPEKERL